MKVGISIPRQNYIFLEIRIQENKNRDPVRKQKER